MRNLLKHIFFSSELAEFPTFTICPDYDVAYKTEALKTYGATPRDMRNFNYPSKINMTSIQFFESVTHSMSELIRSIEIEAKHKLEGTNFSEFFFMFGNDLIQRPKYMKVVPELETLLEFKNYTQFGRCYGFKIPKEITNLRVM